jgi:hypothetical protein
MRVRSDLTNRRFGRLVAIAPARQAKSGKIIWLCRCDCGKMHEVKVDNLTGGHTQSCGCLVSECKRTPEESRHNKNAVTRDWNRRNKSHVSQYRRSVTLRKHHVSAERYEALLESQNGVCAICKRPPQVFGVRYLDIDHDHRCCPGVYSCGKCVRGLVCIACNRALGLFQDDIQVLISAAKYLNPSGIVGAVTTERELGEPPRKLQSELHGDMQSAAEMTAPAKIN